MDAITILKRDHEQMRRLFDQLERARSAPPKRTVAERLVRLLSQHAAIEEQLLYPLLRQRGEELDELALQSLEEHHVVKWLVHEIDGLTPSAERFDAKIHVLRENVLSHLQEEEKEIFPLMRRAFVKEELEMLGELLEQAREVAPTHPHPRAPDTPPGNVVAAGTAAPIDWARDVVRGATRALGASLRQRAGQVREGAKRLPSTIAARTARKRRR